MISVVIPVHNEERSVALLYDELAAAFAGEGRVWEAVFVDDGSTDGTFGALTRLHDAQENVRVVRLRRNFGKAAALDAGFGEAAGEIVVTIDGDLQDDPAEIPRLLAKLDAPTRVHLVIHAYETGLITPGPTSPSGRDEKAPQ